MLVVFVGRYALLLGDLLNGPKFAAAIIVNRDRERSAFPDPPFGRVQRTFAFKGRAAPAAELCFPLRPR